MQQRHSIQVCFGTVLYPVTDVEIVLVLPKASSVYRWGRCLPRVNRSLCPVHGEIGMFLPSKKCGQSFHSQPGDTARHDPESKKKKV